MKTIAELDEEDLQIERGEVEAPDGMLYPRNLMVTLQTLLKEKEMERPRGKESPVFSEGEAQAILTLILYKPAYIRLRVYRRVPGDRTATLKQRKFLEHLFGAAKCNAAKAVRMAGYSPRSAKQIAYKLMHSI